VLPSEFSGGRTVTKPEEFAAQSDIAALAIAEQRYRALVRATSSLVWATAADGQIVDMPEWRAYTGESVEQIKGWGWLNSLHPDDRERTAVVWQRAVDGRSFYETDYRIRRNDGVYVWHRARGVPVLEADGSIREWVGICLDITQRRQTEEKRIEAETALRRLNETLEQRVQAETRERLQIWNVSQDLLVIFGFDGKYLSVNPAWTATLGWSEADLLGKSSQRLLHPDDRKRTRAELDHLAKGHKTLRFENRLRAKDGSYHWISWKAAPDSGRIYSMGRDITEHKRAEEALRELESDLAHMNRLSMMGELTASIAHEVNQPIAATVLNAETGLRWLGAEPPDLDEARQAFGDIVRDGNRAAAVVQRIRNLSKKAPARDERVDVNAAIREVIELIRSEAMKNGVSMRTELVEGLLPVQGDRVKLQQVILNLILNAIEAMSEMSEGSRELLITTGKTESGDVFVAMRDSGPGLAPAALEHLFEAFHTTKPNGLGLGLSFCRSIIEGHGGRLWASANAPAARSYNSRCPPRRLRQNLRKIRHCPRPGSDLARYKWSRSFGRSVLPRKASWPCGCHGRSRNSPLSRFGSFARLLGQWPARRRRFPVGAAPPGERSSRK
jgi:PAS domain S-box-containing protein